MSAAGRLLFAEDGCLRPNIRTTDYAVYVRAQCEHVKVRGAVFIVAAESAELAAAFVAEWQRVPQNHVISAQPASLSPAADWVKSTGYTGKGRDQQ